eukprot:TRINITY_DN20418_c0_g1_i1.p1 TRINITY_DN20418_c0_g1~~TRINITY_DN20418_c0_g1_i1.p1  ORF type:complete len:116 (-),score=31.96 TRINITY_DN20418_c0_g1_i1:126-473(-)
MLRSLVGSEMCIRDRPNGVWSDTALAALHLTTHTTTIKNNTHPEENSSNNIRQKTRDRRGEGGIHQFAFVFSNMTPLNDSINTMVVTCLLYTSDAADEEDSVDLGGRRIIKKKKK